jgi:hypothetical protein
MLTELALRVTEKLCLHFEPIEEGSAAWHLTEDNSLTHTFDEDYEKLPGGRFRFHVDTGIYIHRIAKGLTRTTCECEFDGTLDELFRPYVISVIVKGAFNVCVNEMKLQCADIGRPLLQEWTVPDETVNMYTTAWIENYFREGKRIEEGNRRMTEKEFIGFTPGWNIEMLINGTFMITDEVVLKNPLFKREQNFKNLMQSSKYQSLKLKCMKVAKEDVSLNLLESTWLVICIDLALQMLIGDYADVLAPSLLKSGMTEETKKEYIEIAGGFIESVNESLKQSKATVTDLEERKDWSSIIQLA